VINFLGNNSIIWFKSSKKNTKNKKVILLNIFNRLGFSKKCDFTKMVKNWPDGDKKGQNWTVRKIRSFGLFGG
jgi:hypothetical protein